MRAWRKIRETGHPSGLIILGYYQKALIVSSILTKRLSFFNIILVKFCTDWLKIIYKSSISNTAIEIMLILNQNPSHIWRSLTNSLSLPSVRGHVHMTSAQRGTRHIEGVGWILTKGREVAWIWYWQGEGRGSKILKICTSFVDRP